MGKLKCGKCGSVFEYQYKPLDSLVHVGPYKRVKCPSCSQTSWQNAYSSVKDPVTWPPQQKTQQAPEARMSDEELEKKRIEESKYEKP
jgi:hypothetical protein